MKCACLRKKSILGTYFGVRCYLSAHPDVEIDLSDFHIQQDKDKFGNDVTFLARPLPVEYLIIDVSIFNNTFCFFSAANYILTLNFQKTCIEKYYFLRR